MISHTAEYALRAVVRLARSHQEPLTTQQIATETKLPAGYLSKVLQSLARAGILRSQRGLHGGFTLRDGIGNLTVLEVINAVDPLRRMERCPAGASAHEKGLCPLHQTIDTAIAAAEKYLGTVRIQDLLEEETRQKIYSGVLNSTRS